MEKNEALKRIEAIMQTIEASNRIFISSTHMTLFGIIILLIPVIEFGFSRICLSVEILKQPFISLIAHILFYLLLFIVVNLVFLKGKCPHEGHNITIKTAFRIFRVIFVSIIGFIILLNIIGQEALVCPVVLILLGIFYNLLGQFSIKIIRVFSWTYIILGFTLAYINNKFGIPHSWMIFTIYLGISYIIMGYVLRRKS